MDYLIDARVMKELKDGKVKLNRSKNLYIFYYFLLMIEKYKAGKELKLTKKDNEDIMYLRMNYQDVNYDTSDLERRITDNIDLYMRLNGFVEFLEEARRILEGGNEYGSD